MVHLRVLSFFLSFFLFFLSLQHISGFSFHTLTASSPLAQRIPGEGGDLFPSSGPEVSLSPVGLPDLRIYKETSEPLQPLGQQESPLQVAQ